MDWIENEPCARSDVGQGAGLVLLKEEETLLPLRQQPLNRELDALRILPPQPTGTAAPIEKSQCNQPPQCRIDTPQIPEISLLPLQIHELRNLSVRCLVFRQCVQTRCGGTLQRSIAGHRHPDRTYGSVSPEYCGIAAFAGPRTAGSGQDAGRRQTALQ